jgi:ribosomal protein S27E
MEGIKVKCRSCGAGLYETTKTYDPEKPLNGGMLRLREPFYSYRWQCYDGALGDPSTPQSRMLCTRCGGYVAINGKLVLAEPVEEFVCKVCGRTCGSKAGLYAHMRSHKNKEPENDTKTE